MSGNHDVASAMKTALDLSGDLIKLRAQLEDNVLDALKSKFTPQFVGPTRQAFPKRLSKPAMPPDVLLVNELIHQYLLFAGFKNTAAVLSVESGLPQTPTSGEALRSKSASFNQFSNDKPILCSMVSAFKSKEKEQPIENKGRGVSSRKAF